MPALYEMLHPCGPVIDAASAARVWEAVAFASNSETLLSIFQMAWPSLEPIFSASPYLARTARQDPNCLARVLTDDPKKRLERILRATLAAGYTAPGEAEPTLRRLKAEIHLLVALADLSCIWNLTEVTNALSRFADAAVQAAIRVAATEQTTVERMLPGHDKTENPIPGFFCIAMGKHGAFELNYSSDIDLILLYDQETLPLSKNIEPALFAARLCDRVTSILQSRTTDGYVFRVDLRLRPDPSSTPAAVPVNAAHVYYETVGQNWERAAFIKARPIAGDIRMGIEFIQSLQPFIWRKNLDYAAIFDIQSILAQIRANVTPNRLSARGIDLKLGRGGIREIEFFVQTQQLILGGRHANLRSPRTLDALEALARAGHVSGQTARDLKSAYESLRNWEHRTQMVGDEQTHHIPLSAQERRGVASLAGFRSLQRFDAEIVRTLKSVSRNCDDLFADHETQTSPLGNLFFAGVEDDPNTIETLARMGFRRPRQVSDTIRNWRHGRIPATRSERGRELLTRLTPHLLDAARRTGVADDAFNRFAIFFSSVKTGVQLQSMFLANPRLLDLVVRILSLGPRTSHTLARYPFTLDAMLDPTFFGPLESDHNLYLSEGTETDFEAAMNAARRNFREKSFRICVQILASVVEPGEAGRAFTRLAESTIEYLARASIFELEGKMGKCPGSVAVIALGKCGSYEMSARSDLDLMTLYQVDSNAEAAGIESIGQDTFFARFTQRLVAALSAPTVEGELYQVDMQLRPSGTKGPVAVNINSFNHYYDSQAEVWELLAMTRARVVWASSPGFETVASAAIERALRRERCLDLVARETREMRNLLSLERPAGGFWDMKFVDGGLVDVEFTAQFLQLAHASSGGPLRQNTGEALVAMSGAGFLSLVDLDALSTAWILQQDLSQLLKVALEAGADVDEEPTALRRLLAKAGKTRSFGQLRGKLEAVRVDAHRTFERIVSQEVMKAPASPH